MKACRIAWKFYKKPVNIVSTLTEEISKRRTFAIISHPDAGKTTLTEKLLLFGGAIHIAGAVKSNKIKKTATSDWMEIEKQRGISVATSVMGFNYGDYKINILDTPGHQDFAEDTYRTLTAVDSVIIVVDVAKGVETQTRKLMEVCRMRNTPVIVFVNKLDRVLISPSNMAEMIRTNGRTDIFSHILDRFSAPYYNATLTNSHAQLTGIRDSVFEKRYMASRSKNGEALLTDPYGNTFQYPLEYDPGWNQYYPDGQTLETDMGAMFVPSDDVLAAYFLPGGAGEFLMEAYAKKDNTRENLIYNIDQIPLRVIQAFVMNLMKTSFIGTVPSKYITIMNDAKDPMFGTLDGGVEGFKATIDTTLLANNGAVYIMNQLFAPAKYAAVSSPALVGRDMKIFNWAISADDSYITNPNSAPLNAFFSYYLLAMSSRFSFLVPTDEALGTYYDEASSQSQQPRVLSFYYSTRLQDRAAPVKARAYSWDPVTNEIGNSVPGTISASIINNRLKDLLDSHIIVHSDAESATGFGSLNQYYVTKGGSAVKISNTTDGRLTSDFDQTSTGFYVQGGFQVDNDSLINVLRTYDRRQETTGYGNGMTYVIDRPIQTTMKSVYSVLADGAEASPFYQFFNLCQIDADILDRAGLLRMRLYRKRSTRDFPHGMILRK